MCSSRKFPSNPVEKNARRDSIRGGFGTWPNLHWTCERVNPFSPRGGSKLSYSNVTIHFLVLTYFATIYLILTPIQLPSTFKKMSDKGYWKRFCEYLRIRKRKTSSHILCMYVYLLLSTYYLSVIR